LIGKDGYLRHNDYNLTPAVQSFTKTDYTLKEFIVEQEPKLSLIWDQFYKELGINSDRGFCFPLMIHSKDKQLKLYSLLPLVTLDKYQGIIPENPYDFKCNLNLINTFEEIRKIPVKIGSSSLLIETHFYVSVFEVTNVEEISYPDDYFISGLKILTEELSRQFLSEATEQKSLGINKNYSLIQQLTLHRIRTSF